MAPKVITESELAVYLSRKREAEAAKLAASALAKEVDAIEKDLIARLQDGAKVRAKGWQAVVSERVGRVSPSWKGAFEALAQRMGLSPGAEVAKVLAETEPSRKCELTVVAPEGWTVEAQEGT